MTKSKFIIVTIFIVVFYTSCQKNNLNIEEAKIISTFEYGDSMFYKGNLVKSFESFNEIVNVPKIENLNDSLQTTYLMSLCYLGMIHERLGNEEKALKTYLDCKNLAQQLDRIDFQINAITNISYLSSDDKDIRKLLEEALDEFGNYKGNEIPLNGIVYKLSLLEAQNGNYDKARNDVNEMFSKSIYKDEETSLVVLYKCLGRIDFFEENYEKAISNYQKGLEIEHRNSMEKAKIYLLLSQAYFKIEAFQEMENTLSKAEEYIVEDLMLQRKLNELYSKLYERTNNTQKSINTLNNLRKIDNTLNNKNNKIQGYLSDKLENDKLKASNQLKGVRIKYISGIGILSLLLMSLFYFYKQARNKKDKLQLEVSKEKLQVKNKVLEVKNKELELTAINKIIDAQEKKQKEFAQILHDNIGANLSAINMHLSTLRREVPENKLTGISDLLRTTIKDTRDLSHSLEPPALKGAGLISAVIEKAEEFCCDKLNIEVSSSEEYVALEGSIARSLYNAILEFMNNTMRYAEATKMQIDFSKSNNRTLAVKVTDNGKGFDTSNIQQSSKGLGLNSIRSRIKYFGGSFDIKSSDKGTVIDLIVPAKAALKQSA